LLLTALAIDAGNEMAARRHAQNCSDSAALAGCIELATLQAQGTTPTSQNITNAALASATANNFNNGTNCTITVNSPPKSGGYQDSDSVEVLLTFTYKNLVVTGSNSVTVRSVASCDMGTAPSTPMLVTDPTGAKAFWVNSGSLTLSTAPVQVNSNNASAAVVDGSYGSPVVNATVDAVGGTSGSFSPAANSGGTAVKNPLALLPVPDKTNLTTITQSSFTPDSNGNVTLNPGYYPNGLYVTHGGNVTLNPGLYYVEHGNLWINTTGSVTGNGVTIYHNGSDSTAQLMQNYGLDVGICLCLSNSNYSITAPTSGTYAGISLFQSPNYSGEAFYDFWGTGSLNVGVQYFPGGTLRAWSVKNGIINCNQLIAKDFKITGSHEIYGTSQNNGFSKITWNASRSSNYPTTNVALVE
jgi:hypothetical protein